MDEILDVSSRAADKFVPVFYNLFDRQRHQIAKLYKDSSVLLWNGAPIAGSAAIIKTLFEFPITDHEVLSYDCQPVTCHGSNDLLISIFGSVRYGDQQQSEDSKDASKRRRSFHQTLLLKPEPGGTYFIATDVFRYV